MESQNIIVYGSEFVWLIYIQYCIILYNQPCSICSYDWICQSSFFIYTHKRFIFVRSIHICDYGYFVVVLIFWHLSLLHMFTMSTDFWNYELALSSQIVNHSHLLFSLMFSGKNRWGFHFELFVFHIIYSIIISSMCGGYSRRLSRLRSYLFTAVVLVSQGL